MKEAESVLLPLLEKWRNRYDDAHLETLRTVDNLANVYLLQGDFTQAKTLFTKALEGRRRALGDSSPDVLRTASGLAVAEDNVGATDNARKLLAATLATQRKALGDEHVDTLTTLERLADFHRRHVEYDAAKSLFTEALGVLRRLFGKEHPDTLDDLSKLALVEFEQSKYAQVQSLLQDVTVLSGSVADSWQRAFSQGVLGAALSEERKYEQAEQLLTEGYQRMAARSESIPADGRNALQIAGQWIVQLYRASGKPQLASDWSARIEAMNNTRR